MSNNDKLPFKVRILFFRIQRFFLSMARFFRINYTVEITKKVKLYAKLK